MWLYGQRCSLSQGFAIVGPIQRSLRWGLLPAPDDSLSLDDLRSRAWEFSQKVTKNVARCDLTEHTAKVWEATMEDVAEGSTLGPFFSASKRCPSSLARKSGSPHNALRSITEKLGLPSTDVNVAALGWLRSKLPKGTDVQGWVLDERKAYRQIAVKPDQRRWSTV